MMEVVHHSYMVVQTRDAKLFESWLNTDDGSCIYPCTDATATNYDPNANLDDGSCQYALLVVLSQVFT